MKLPLLQAPADLASSGAVTHAPDPHGMLYDSPLFWDPKHLDSELERVFSICNGCRLCFNVCPVDDCIIDREHLIVSTPAYMLAGSISEAASGIEKAIKATLELIR